MSSHDYRQCLGPEQACKRLDETEAQNERLRKALEAIVDGIEETNSMPCSTGQFNEAKAVLGR